MKTSVLDALWLNECVRLARRGMERGEGGPFGAVIVRRNRIIARGWNRVLVSHDPTAHAEMMAIRRAAKRLGSHELDECVLYTSCEPCPMCLGAIDWAGIRRVIFAADRRTAARGGFSDEAMYRDFARAIQARRRVRLWHVDSPSSASLWREWRSKPDRTLY